MDSATKKIFENENYMSDHIKAVLDSYNKRAEKPKRSPKAPISIWDVPPIENGINLQPCDSTGTNRAKINISKIENKNVFLNFIDSKRSAFQTTAGEKLLISDVFEERKASKNSLDNDVHIQTKTRHLTPEKHYPIKKQCRIVDFSLDISVSGNTETFLDPQTEMRYVDRDFQLKKEIKDDNEQKLQKETLSSKPPTLNDGAPAFEVLMERSSDVDMVKINDVPQEINWNCESSQISGIRLETNTIANLDSSVAQETSKMAAKANDLSSQEGKVSLTKGLLIRSPEKSIPECENMKDGNRNEKLNENLNWRSSENNQTSWPSRKRNNSCDTNNYKDFSDWAKERQQSWKSLKEVNSENPLKRNNNKTGNLPSKVETPKKEDAHMSLNITNVLCSEGDNSMICLLVTGSNGSVEEVTLERKVLQYVQTKFPGFIPRIEDNVKSLSHSAEAIVTFLRFIIMSPYNIRNWKVALELLYLGKKLNFPKLVKMCEKYLFNCNPSQTEMQEIVFYAKHFKVVEELGKIFTPEIPSAFLDLFRTDHKFKIVPSTCFISTNLYVEPLEFCIPLLKMKPQFKDSFNADIRNELLFESMKGSFCITGIQIKLESNVGNCEDRILVICDVFKGSTKLISEEKIKNSKSSIFFNFNKKIMVADKETAKIAVLIEDIPPSMCGRAPKMKMTETVEGNHFAVTLSTSKISPLIFIEKLFYTINP